MNTYRLALPLCLFLGLALAVFADDNKDTVNKKRILGTWVGVEGPRDFKNATVQFMKDGKGILTIKRDDGNQIRDFTYEIDGDSLKTTAKDKDGKERPQTYTIKSLADKELAIENQRGELAKFNKKEYFTAATGARDADEFGRLRRENELLKRENELLKKEIDLVKKQTPTKPNIAENSKSDEKGPRTKASVGVFNPDIDPVDYELVKCVRNSNTRVNFTFAVQSESGKVKTIHFVKRLNLTTSDGKELDGRLVKVPSGMVMLTKGESTKFQVSYEGVDSHIAEFGEVGLVMGGQATTRAPVKFYRIKIEAKE